MQYPLECYSPIGEEPPDAIIPASEMRAFARLSGLEQDGELALAQAAALDYISGPQGYLISVWRRQWRLEATAALPDYGGAIDLRMANPASVDVFEYRERLGGALSHLATADSEDVSSAVFLVPERRLLCPVAANWPSVEWFGVTLRAGLVDPSASSPADKLPAQLRQAIKILTLALWEDRSGEMVVPKAVDAICRSFGGGAYA